ncbi:MAG: alpha/beta hydrolase [Candidatus Krumholzibacteriia bacterium]
MFRRRGLGARIVLAGAALVCAGLACLCMAAGVVIGRASRLDLVERLQRAAPVRIEPLGHESDDVSDTWDLVIEDHVGPVRATLRVPKLGSGPYPALVILGGLDTGRRAVQLLAPELPYAVAALDYAYTGPRKMRLGAFLVHAPGIHRDLQRTGVALRDLVRYVAARPEVDASRVYIIGASLGVPLSCAVAAAQPPAGLAVLFGFADHKTLLEHRLRPYVGSAAVRHRLATWGALLTAGFEVTHSLPKLCGTPVLVVSSPEDLDLPPSSVEAVWESTCEPRRRIDVGGGHIRAHRDDAILEQVTAAVHSWLQEIDSGANVTRRSTAAPGARR